MPPPLCPIPRYTASPDRVDSADVARPPRLCVLPQHGLLDAVAAALPHARDERERERARHRGRTKGVTWAWEREGRGRGMGDGMARGEREKGE